MPESDLYVLPSTGGIWQPASAGNPVPVVIVDGTGITTNVIATATFTRPSNTTPYTANTAVGTAATPIVPIQFSLAAAAGVGGSILNALLVKSTTSLTNATFRLHLFDKMAPTLAGINDGSAYAAPSIADYTNYVGYFDFVAGVASSDAAYYQGAPSQSLLTFIAATNSRIVYGVLEVTAAYTPGNAEVFDFRLVSQAS